MFAILLLSLIGCAPSCDEVEGAVCADDLVITSTGYAWFDQRGTQVTDGPELVWFDEQDVLWQVDPERAITLPQQSGTYDPSRYFESSDCSGEPLVKNHASPMVAYVEYTSDIVAETALYREFDSPLHRIVPGSEMAGAECSDWTGTLEMDLIAEDSILEAYVPDVDWLPPLAPSPL